MGSGTTESQVRPPTSSGKGRRYLRTVPKVPKSVRRGTLLGGRRRLCLDSNLDRDYEGSTHWNPSRRTGTRADALEPEQRRGGSRSQETQTFSSRLPKVGSPDTTPQPRPRGSYPGPWTVNGGLPHEGTRWRVRERQRRGGKGFTRNVPKYDHRTSDDTTLTNVVPLPAHDVRPQPIKKSLSTTNLEMECGVPPPEPLRDLFETVNGPHQRVTDLNPYTVSRSFGGLSLSLSPDVLRLWDAKYMSREDPTTPSRRTSATPRVDPKFPEIKGLERRT